MLLLRRNKAGIFWILATVAFLFVIVGSIFISVVPPKPPPVIVVPPGPKPVPIARVLTPDKGWYGVLHLKGEGMSIVPDFTVPVPFKFIWKCNPSYGPHWLREAVYQVKGKEFSDIVNFTCAPGKLIQAHGLATYPPGTYTIDIMSHVSQGWELLVEVHNMG